MTLFRKCFNQGINSIACIDYKQTRNRPLFSEIARKQLVSWNAGRRLALEKSLFGDASAVHIFHYLTNCCPIALRPDTHKQKIAWSGSKCEMRVGTALASSAKLFSRIKYIARGLKVLVAGGAPVGPFTCLFATFHGMRLAPLPWIHNISPEKSADEIYRTSRAAQVIILFKRPRSLYIIGARTDRHLMALNATCARIMCVARDMLAHPQC
jgi:hypothetical protein